MSYETAQATSISDLFSKLATFATANGWTNDHSATDRLFLTRSTVSVAFRWSTSSPTCAAIYQHTAFLNSGTDPGNHTNDSGQGEISGTDATLLLGRNVVLPDSNVTYHFFESDTYLHAVVEYQNQRFVHFGMGILVKHGTYTGGEYAYGTRNGQSGTGNIAVSDNSSYLLDGLLGKTGGNLKEQWAASLHLESLANQPSGGKWGLVWAGGNANVGNDRGGTGRSNCQGGFRGGPVARSFGRLGGSSQDGLVPMYPINTYYDDPSNARWYPLGYMPDVRGIMVEHYSGGDEITVGSDTWVIFPTRYKTVVASADGTRYSGIAYKKVTT